MSSLINKDTINDIYDAIDEINDLMFSEKTYPYAPVLNIKNALPIPAVDCKVKVKPIQDLHGYDHPWPAGGEKNKLPLVLADIKANNTSGTWSGNVYSVANGTVEILVDNADNVIGIKLNGTFTSQTFFALGNAIDFEAGMKLNGWPSGVTNGGLVMNHTSNYDTGNGVTLTVSGHDIGLLQVDANATFSNAIVYPMLRASTESDATFAPYSNICPISGIDEVEIGVSGKNLFDVGNDLSEWLTTENNGTKITSNPISSRVTANLDRSTGSIVVTNYDKIGWWWMSKEVKLSKNTNYRFVNLRIAKKLLGFNSLNAGSIGTVIAESDSDSTFNSGDYKYWVLSIFPMNVNTNNVMVINDGVADTEFEPYKGEPTTTTIPLPSTLYGGTIRGDEGSADSQFGIAMFDGSNDESISIVDSGRRARIGLSNVKTYDSEVLSPLKSNEFETVTNVSTYSGTRGISQDNNKIYVSDGSGNMDLTSFKAFLAEHPLQVCYELATPTTISLTPTDVELLEGTNVVSTNAESVELTVGGLVDNIDYLGSDQIITGKKTINNDLYVNGDIYIWGTKFNNKYMFGFHIDSSESDGDATVTYLNDARGITPAYMDYTTGKFNYGGWGDAFFMPKPCMLKYDGTVDYYLDPNDFSKTINGASSDISDFSYNGNAMIEWGRDNNLIWVSVIPDSNSEDGSSYTVRIANYEADSTFHPWSHYAYNNKIVPHFYTPIYNGTIDGSGRLRSISGKDYTAYCKNKSRAEEIAAAMANDPDANTKIWYTETLADNKLIEYLLTLISKSLASQTKFGEGRTGYQWAESNLATTGLMDAKGMFYGENTTTGLGVKVFGREHRWGNQWQAEAGLINDNGAIKVKLTRGTVDGSSASDYNTDATGYLTVANITPTGTSGSYIKKAKADSMGIVLPFDASGSASTYYGDGLWFNNGQLNYALRGGGCVDGSPCGAFCSDLSSVPGSRSWHLGAGLSCKPLL